MGNLSVYEALIPNKTSRKETNFRIAAHLCVRCGLERPLEKLTVCFHCCEELHVQRMREERKAWERAA